MKKDNITGKNAERWKKLNNMSDAEIDAAIADDPDAQVPNSEDFLAKGTFVKSGEMVVPIVLDIKTINYLTEQHIDYKALATSFLKDYANREQHKNGV